jgi:signal transduction histidine kinase
VVNATVGVAMLGLAGKIPWSIYGRVWLTWWISNVAGIFIVTPVIVSWHHWLVVNIPGLCVERRVSLQILQRSLIILLWHCQHWLLGSKEHFLEVCIVTGLLVKIGILSFWGDFPLAYMVIPLLIWIAFRFGQAGATGATLGISAIAILGTVRGLGNFADSDLNRSLGLLQSFIAVTVFTTLILTAVLAEQQATETQLKFAYSELAAINGDLEDRVNQRTQELHEKNVQLNRILEELKRAESQMIQSEKMSGLSQLVAGIAHEVNNPINFIHGNLPYVEAYVNDLLDYVHLYEQQYPNPVAAIQMKAEEIDLGCVLKLRKVLS